MTDQNTSEIYEFRKFDPKKEVRVTKNVLTHPKIKSIKAQWVTMNNKLAVSLLRALPDYQRNPKTKNIPKIVSDLIADDWITNGETIKVSEEGELIDGQNRLRAMVQSGIYHVVLIITGIPKGKEAYRTIDIGSPRNATDAFKSAGINGYAVKSSISKAVAAYNMRSVMGRHNPASIEGLLELYFENEKLFSKWVKRSMNLDHLISKVNRGAVSIVAELHYGDEDSILDFWEIVETGIGKGDADAAISAVTFRNFLLRNANSVRGKMKSDVVYAYAIKSIRAYMSGRPLKGLKWHTKEDFPRFDDEK